MIYTGVEWQKLCEWDAKQSCGYRFVLGFDNENLLMFKCSGSYISSGMSSTSSKWDWSLNVCCCLVFLLHFLLQCLLVPDVPSNVELSSRMSPSHLLLSSQPTETSFCWHWWAPPSCHSRSLYFSLFCHSGHVYCIFLCPSFMQRFKLRFFQKNAAEFSAPLHSAVLLIIAALILMEIQGLLSF